MSARLAMRPAIAALLAPLGLYLAWTAATWVLEGRVRTLQRPEAAFDRALYAVVANLLIGIAGAAWVLRGMAAAGLVDRRDAGFGSAARTAFGIAAGLALGFGLYLAQGAPTLDPVVLANAFAQVLVVFIAEVMVCWAVAGAAVEAILRARGWPRPHAAAGAAVAASILFGACHYAHSPPFNSHAMVALLAAVGLATSLFFLVLRDVHGTIALHNWLGVFGVAQALRDSDVLAAFSVPQPPLLVIGALGVAAIVAADLLLIRRRTAAAPERRHA